MKWHKVLVHDLRRGLMRWRYLFVPLICIACCFNYLFWSSALSVSGSWMDIVFFIFQGQEPINIAALSSVAQFPIPFAWILVMGSCLYLNLDYFLMDLSLTGQQIIIRCKSRVKWFLSKCIWNILSTTLYFALIWLTALIFGCCIGSTASLKPTPVVLQNAFGLAFPPEVSIWQALMVGILLPFFTLSALNLLQMSLCIFTKPIASFMLCVEILLLSVYVPNDFVLGNGAMTIRSEYVTNNGSSPVICLMTSCAIIALCVAVGTWRFSRLDILPSDE